MGLAPVTDTSGTPPTGSGPRPRTRRSRAFGSIVTMAREASASPCRKRYPLTRRDIGSQSVPHDPGRIDCRPESGEGVAPLETRDRLPVVADSLRGSGLDQRSRLFRPPCWAEDLSATGPRASKISSSGARPGNGARSRR